MEASKILNDNGFYEVRRKGDHVIFKNEYGKTISITCGKAFSQKTWKRECKKNGIVGEF